MKKLKSYNQHLDDIGISLRRNNPYDPVELPAAKMAQEYVRYRPVEHAFVIDELGHPINHIVGKEGEVSVNVNVPKGDPKAALVVHNHPRVTGEAHLSPGDIRGSLYDQTPIAAVSPSDSATFVFYPDRIKSESSFVMNSLRNTYPHKDFDSEDVAELLANPHDLNNPYHKRMLFLNKSLGYRYREIPEGEAPLIPSMLQDAFHVKGRRTIDTTPPDYKGVRQEVWKFAKEGENTGSNLADMGNAYEKKLASNKELSVRLLNSHLAPIVVDNHTPILTESASIPSNGLPVPSKIPDKYPEYLMQDVYYPQIPDIEEVEYMDEYINQSIPEWENQMKERIRLFEGRKKETGNYFSENEWYDYLNNQEY